MVTDSPAAGKLHLRFAAATRNTSEFARRAALRIQTIPGVSRVETEVGTDMVQIRFHRPTSTLLREIHTALQGVDAD